MKCCRSQIRQILTGILLLCAIAELTQLMVFANTPDIASLQKQAKEGNAEAQYELANAYFIGNGVSRDAKQGMGWLEKAAKLDHPGAQLALSTFLLKGGGADIPKDPKKGLEWLRKSADHGYAPAEYSLGVLYQDGDEEAGIGRNPHEAASWFRKALKQQASPKSQAALEEMLDHKLISKQEANWRAPEQVKRPEKGKTGPFSFAEIEIGLKGAIAPARMATLVHMYGVNFKLSDGMRQHLKDDGADDKLLQTISDSQRSS